MNAHHRSIRDVLAAVRVQGDRGYRWLGRIHPLPPRVLSLAPPEGRRSALAAALGWRLYAGWFTRGHPVPAGSPLGDELGRRRFVERLSAANPVRRSIEPGWTFTGHDRGCAVLERNGVRLWAEPEDIGERSAEGLAPGDRVSVRLPGESRRLSPGFYMAFSPRGLDDDRPRLLDRFYLNLDPDGAVRMMELATRRFADGGLPYRLKVLDDPSEFDRCDCVVLATQRKDRPAALHLVRELHGLLTDHLGAETPALTHPLAPGLGFAEDPGDGTSFGAHRCHLIAAALLDADVGGRREDADRLAAVLQHLHERGVDRDLPFRMAGSAPPPCLPAARPPEVPACR